MILLEEKIKIFNQMIYKKHEKECNEKIRKFEEFKNIEIDKKKEEIQNTQIEMVSRRKKLASQKKYEMIAKVNEDRRIMELEKNEKLLDDLINELLKRCDEFTKTPSYKSYLIKDVEMVLKTLSPEKYHINLVDEDLKTFKDIISKEGEKYGIDFIFEIMEDSEIGGFIISNFEKTYDINGTFRNKIVGNRRDIGKILNSQLVKAGETLE